ncbi:MAG: hypothetical protein WDO69_11910 [Pseudomonadota bacterium]
MNKLLFAPLALSLVCNAALSQAQESPAAESTVPAEPPAPPASVAPEAPPAAAVTPAPAPPVPAGQWVYTSQYGWLWMPYGQAYTYVQPDSDAAYTYAYYPAYGWQWVASPWIFGLGPAPYWGVHGRVGFTWYAHPWFHPAYAYHGNAYHGGVYRTGAYHGGGYHAPSHVSHAGGGFHGGGHGHR